MYLEKQMPICWQKKVVELGDTPAPPLHSQKIMLTRKLGSTNWTILSSWMEEYGEHCEHGEHGKMENVNHMTLTSLYL